MELKLKDDTQEKNIEKKTPVDLSDEYIAGIEPENKMGNNPYATNTVKITTNINVPDTDKNKNDLGIMTIIKWAIIVSIVIIAGKFIIGKLKPEIIDVTKYKDLSAQELETQLDVTLTDDSSMITKIPQYSNGTVTVEGNGDIGVVYIDGVQKGVHVQGRYYSMYGINIGDGEFLIDNNLTYEYDESFTVLNDMISGGSTAAFYFNRSRNDCMVIIINDNSARVVAMTYFNDYRKISENLSGIDD